MRNASTNNTNHNMTEHKKDFEKVLSHPTGLNFLPLGGCGEIGMNANFYSCDGQWIMVDNGVTFSNKPSGVIMTDIRSFVENIKEKSIQGIFVTHAHEDHAGAVAYLWPYLQCKIYATPFTAFIVRQKLADLNISTDSVIEVPIDSTVTLDDFTIDFVSLTHSVPEPSALFIQTKHGNIFHTGDWKIDPDPIIGAPIDEKVIQSIGAKGVRALVCDSTNVFEPGTAGSESSVRDALHKAVQKCTGRVVISCFSSNIARIHSCYHAAVAEGRKVCLIGRSLERMVEAARYCGYFGDDMVFIAPEEMENLSPAQSMIITTGSQAEPRAGLTRMSIGTHPLVTLNEQDMVIFSSRVIPGNQEAISDLKNRLVRKNIGMIVYQEDIHVSGHPCQGDLAQMYQWLKPEILIPVHGEDIHIKKHAEFAKEQGVPHTIRPHNGTMFSLSSSQPKLLTHVPTGRLMVDGIRLIESDGRAITQRTRLLEDGMLSLVVAVSKKDKTKILSRVINSYGVFDHDKERQETENQIKKIATDHIAPSEHSEEKKQNKGLPKYAKIERSIRYMFKKRLGTTPVIKVSIVDI